MIVEVSEISQDLIDLFKSEDMNGYSFPYARTFVFYDYHRPIAAASYTRIAKARGGYSDLITLNNAVVSKEFRGKGLQKELIKARIESAKKEGCKKALVCVHPSNFASYNSLKSCGFNECEYNSLVSHIGTITMEKNL